jgi:hypothetical protein
MPELLAKGKQIVKSAEQKQGNQAATLFVVALPLCALLLLQVLVYFPNLTSSGNISAATSVTCMVFVCLGIYKAISKLGFQPSLLNFFLCVCTFTSACDLGISGYLVGVWKLGSFYPKHGEKYFDTAYGVACLGWDGVFHTILQGFLARRSLLNQPLKPYVLTWAGSVIYSMMPLLMGGAATGKFSNGVQASTALNAPYVLIPIILCFKLFGESGSGTSSRKSMYSGASCLVQGVSHGGMVFLHTIQLMAVLQSKAGVAQWWLSKVEPVLRQTDGTNILLIQAVQSFYFSGMYHCFAIWELWYRFQNNSKRSVLSNASDWSALILGGYLQGACVQLLMATSTYHKPGKIVFDFGPVNNNQLIVGFGTLLVVGYQTIAWQHYERSKSD